MADVSDIDAVIREAMAEEFKKVAPIFSGEHDAASASLSCVAAGLAAAVRLLREPADLSVLADKWERQACEMVSVTEGDRVAFALADTMKDCADQLRAVVAAARNSGR